MRTLPLSFTAVVTIHDASYKQILDHLLQQTRVPDEILVFVSAHRQAIELRSADPRVRFFVVANKNDWGHEKRALGLRLASCDAIGWFNHDDEYDLEYVEQMMAEIENGSDVVYCNWSHGGKGCNVNQDCRFAGGNSTSGNWIGRTGLIRSVGYSSRDYSADANLIDAVAATRPLITKVESTLYHHNP